MAGLALPSAASAEEFVPHEPFDYAPGPVLNGDGTSLLGGWDRTGSSVVNPFAVVAGSLEYAPGGLPASVGGKLPLADTGQDMGLSRAGGIITPADGNTYYLSMLVEHDGTDVGTAGGDYFAHFTAGTSGGGTAFRGRLYAVPGTTPGTIQIGTRFSTNSTTELASTEIPANTTAFVVLKLTEVAGTNNDTAEIFVFLDTAVPQAEPASDAISVGNNTDNDIAIIVNGGLGRIGLRQGSSSTAAALFVDEIRSGTTWADVVPFSGPAPGDTCETAVEITGDGSYPWDTAGASSDDVCYASLGDYPTVWFAYTATADGVVDYGLCGSTFNSYIVVYEGTDCASLICDDAVEEANSGCGTNNQDPQGSFPVTAGLTYYFAVQGLNESETGSGDLSFTFTEDTLPVAGDTCETAGVLTEDGTYPFDTTGASNNDPCYSGFGNYPTVWYEYVAPADGDLEFYQCTPSFESYLVIYNTDGCPVECGTPAFDSVSPVTCATDPTGSIPVVAGESYFFAISSFNEGETGAGELTLSFSLDPGSIQPAPTCPTAQVITQDGAYAWDTTGFPSLGNCLDQIGNPPTVWYAYQAQADAPVRFDTCGSSGDTFLFITDVCLDQPDCSFIQLSDDSDLCGTGSTNSSTTYPMTTGELIYIAISTFDGGSPGVLNVTTLSNIDVGTAGDTCQSAGIITGPGTYPFDTTNATANSTCNFGQAAFASPTVWYTYTADAAGTVNFSLCDGTFFDTTLIVFDGSAGCPNSGVGGCDTAIDGNDDGCPEGGASALSVPVAPGDELIVQISGFTATELGPGVLTVTFDGAAETDGEVGSLQCPEATPVGPGATYLVDLSDTPDPAFIINSDNPSIEPNWFEVTKWVSYTPAEDGLATFSLCEGTNYDSVMLLYAGCPVGFGDASNLIALNDDSCDTASELVDISVFAGETLYLSISAFDSAAIGQAVLTIEGPSAQYSLNEVLINPPGGDADLEFVEIRGPAFGDPSDVSFLVIEGEGSGVGTLDKAVSLAGLLDIEGEPVRLSANGYLLLANVGIFGGQQPSRSLPEAPTSYATISTDVVLDFSPDIENGGNTFLLVEGHDSGTAPQGTDLDSDNDGTLDLTPWTVVHDAVSYAGDDGDLEYAAQLGGVNLGKGLSYDGLTDFTADTIFRDVVSGTWVQADVNDQSAPVTRAGAIINMPFGYDPVEVTEERFGALALTPGYFNQIDDIPVFGEVLMVIDECGADLTVLWDGFVDPESTVVNYYVELYVGAFPDIGPNPIFADNFAPNERFVTLTFNPANPPPQGLPFTAVVYADNATGGFDFNLDIAAVEDVTPPTVAALPITVEITAPTFTFTFDAATAQSMLDVANSSDNCSAAEDLLVVDVEPLVLDCDDVAASLAGNPPTVVITVADEAGNTATASAAVTVEDNLPPTLFLTPTVAQLDANGNATISVEDVVIDELSGDGCGEIFLISVVPDTFSCQDAAATDAGNPPVVVVTAEDASGNTVTGTTIVPVADEVAPSIECVGNVTLELDGSGVATLSTEAVFASAPFDACGVEGVDLSASEFGCADAGSTIPVTVTVSDIYGNTATCVVDVTIEDVTPPTLVVTSPVVVLDENGQGSLAEADFVDASTSDNCGWEIVSVSRTTFDCSDLGENGVSVQVAVVDPSGNGASASATVLVVDETAPVVNCPDEVSVFACNDPEGYFFVPDVTDNCPWTYSIDGFPSAVLPFGLTEQVTVRIYDSLGEETQVCVFSAEVIGDEQEPSRLQSMAMMDGTLSRATPSSVATVANGTTSFFVGDSTSNASSRAVVSFDTSLIPADAIITSATVRLHRFSEVGSSLDLGLLQLDVLDPALGTPALEPADFDSAALGVNVGFPTPPPPSIGGGMFIGLVEPAFELLDRSGATQFRLQFPVETDGDFRGDGLTFGSGENGAFNTYTPELIITYYVPTCFGCGINEEFLAGPDSVGPLALQSIANHDGYVGETYEEAGVGSFSNSSSTAFNVGDSAANAQFIGVLSFDTGSLGLSPFDYIERAELRLSRGSLRGDISALGNLNVDMRCLTWETPYFGQSELLEPADFQAATFFSSVATVSQVGTSFNFSAELDETGRENINREGVTQLKLRFDVDDNDNGIADYISFFSGNTGTASRRPTLLLWVRPGDGQQSPGAIQVPVEAPVMESISDRLVRE